MTGGSILQIGMMTYVLEFRDDKLVKISVCYSFIEPA